MVARIIFFLLALIATFLVRNNPFFWDTVQLASKHAHFFYETDFQSIILPEVMDSGHPPAFGMYLAACWKFFGKTLPVSHFAMLPFLLGIIYFLEKIAVEIAPRRYAPWLLALCLIDPVLAGQFTLVSPDIPLICFFLMGLWAVWTERNNWLLVLAVIGLGLVSLRGMSLGMGLFFFAWIAGKEPVSLKSFFKKIWPFVPGGLIALAFLVYHYQETGWIGYHDHSTWAPSFERVDFRGFLKNWAVLGWRLLDFGRLFYWVVLGVVAFYLFRKNRTLFFNTNTVGWRLLVLLLVTFVALVINQLPYRGLLAHRYLLPVFLSMNFLVFFLIFKELSTSAAFSRFRNFMILLLLGGYLTGNFWVYPKKISQGWDSTLAHLHWFGLEKKAEQYLAESEITMSEVGTAFPNIGPREIIELNGAEEGFSPKNMDENCYVLYSNVMNDFTDEEIDELEASWSKIFSAGRMGVCVIIYQNEKSGKCEN